MPEWREKESTSHSHKNEETEAHKRLGLEPRLHMEEGEECLSQPKGSKVLGCEGLTYE